MQSAFALLCHSLSIERLCFLYFFLAPVFLPREDVGAQKLVFALGYMLSGGIVLLALAERLCTFSDTVRIRKHTPMVLALIATCFISVALNTPGKLFSPEAHFHKYFKLIFPVISFFVMINIWTLKDLPKLYTLFLAMAAVSILGLAPEALDYLKDPSELPRIGSFFMDPNKYALFLNILYGMTLSNLISSLLRGKSISTLLALILLIAFLLFLTQSRSGIITCLVITALSFRPVPARRVFVKALPVLVPAALFLLSTFLIRYQSASTNSTASDMGRLWTYMVGFNIITHHPLTGIGFANIISAYDEFGGIYRILLGRALGIHNTPLEIFAEEGVFGAIFYLILILAPIWALFKRIGSPDAEYYPTVEVAAMAIPIAFFCFGMFYPNYLADDYFWVYMAFTFIVLRSKVPDGFEFGMVNPRWT